jgi:hypothetical protein
VCMDACKDGLRGVLSKKDHVECYESRKLKYHENYYSTHELESTSIVHALKIWKHYLMGRIFLLRTNHFGLKHLFGYPTLNCRQTRWLEFLSESDFEIKNIKGKENQVADAVNRRAYEVHLSAINMFNIYLKDVIIEAANSDQQYLKIKETLHQGNLQQKINHYELKEDAILMYKGKIYVPNSREIKNMLLKEMQNVPYAGHPGYQKTIAVVISQYFWLRMKK